MRTSSQLSTSSLQQSADASTWLGLGLDLGLGLGLGLGFRFGLWLGLGLGLGVRVRVKVGVGVRSAEVSTLCAHSSRAGSAGTAMQLVRKGFLVCSSAPR